MTRFLSLIIILLALCFWAFDQPEPIDPALWNQYEMTDLRGH